MQFFSTYRNRIYRKVHLRLENLLVSRGSGKGKMAEKVGEGKEDLK